VAFAAGGARADSATLPAMQTAGIRDGVDAAAAEVVCVASWNADLVCRVPRQPERGETLLASRFDILPGGKGSNAAIACARQGTRVALLARIGDDDFGRMALRLWTDEGIAAGAVEVAAGERSGVAQIWVYDDGDNSIAVAPGAGAGLAARHAQAAAPLLRSARVVMASCEVPLEATLAAFEIARPAGACTLLNPAPAMALPDALWPLIDVLTPNESELHALTGIGDPLLAADAVLARGVRAVVATLGARGCMLFESGHAPRQWPSHSVTVADTIGAGDTFTGALAAALARGEPLPAAARWANAAAALSVTGVGAIGGMPSHDAVSRWLDTAAGGAG
jgi:ribokinase